MHTAPYFAVLGILTVVLGLRVVQMRFQKRVAFGDGGVPEVQQRIRVFGNHTEYSPMGLILLLGLEVVQAPVWYLHLVGGMLVVGRILHASALSKTTRSSPGRFGGMILTFLSIGMASVGLMIFSIL